jgi:hypothetical protein
MPPKIKKKSKRLDYGPAKYAAFHLLLCRWMRHYAVEGKFHYVTLGGTELRDIQSLHYIDDGCAAGIVSYELKRTEHDLALTTCARLQGVGLQIEVRRGDIFSFERVSDEPHLFFIDLKGCCVFEQYYKPISQWLLNDHLRPGDSLLITSHLGFRGGWDKYLPAFSAQFETLEINGEQEQKRCFRRSHISFTLFQALDRIGYQHEISLKCFGCVEYRDRSPMSIVGYSLSEGTTTFHDLVGDTPYFHVRRGLQAP